MGLHIEMTKRMAAFRRHFKGETVLNVFRNGCSSEASEAHFFMVLQAYVSYNSASIQFCFTHVIVERRSNK